MSSSRHFINDAEGLVTFSLRSLTLTNPSLALDEKHKIVYRDYSNSASVEKYRHQVSVISGGGAGHEPSFSGFVGDGMLAAAVSGSIFASPSAQQVYVAITQHVPSARGVLVVIMNYTGDVLNFGMAVEKAKSQGVNVDLVVVGDDVGVGREKSGKVGRRGLAGTCLILKVAGALAAEGRSLAEIAQVVRSMADRDLATAGASLAHVHVPGRDEPSAGQALAVGEAELGMGKHNEPGCKRTSDKLPQLVSEMLAQLLDPKDEDRAYCQFSCEDKIILLVNNLGGLSPLELGGITSEVYNQLTNTYNILPLKTLAGTYMTSLNGLGFSVTLLRAKSTELLDATKLVGFLDIPLISPRDYSRGENVADDSKQQDVAEGDHNSKRQDLISLPQSKITVQYDFAKAAVQIGLQRLIEAAPDVTKYDEKVGDRDCGTCLSRGAKSVLNMLATADSTEDLAQFLDRIVEVVDSSMDGTSGALYSIFLSAVVQAVRRQPKQRVVDTELWRTLSDEALATLGKYTPAQPGDRTLVDALHPFITTLGGSNGSVKTAAEAARNGAGKTRGMKPRLGRSVYVGNDSWQEVPDPGAHGLAELLAGLADGLEA